MVLSFSGTNDVSEELIQIDEVLFNSQFAATLHGDFVV
jgi:hypothetical protein